MICARLKPMSNKTTTSLDAAIKAVRQLPEEAQTAIAEEMIAHAHAITESHLTNEQRAIVKERLRQPRAVVSIEDFQALLDKYKVA